MDLSSYSASCFTASLPLGRSDLRIFSAFLLKASILVKWTGDFMHSIVRRMRCEVNSAAALLASVDLPLRLYAVADCFVDVRGLENGNCHAVGVMALLGGGSGTNQQIHTIDHHPSSLTERRPQVKSGSDQQTWFIIAS